MVTTLAGVHSSAAVRGSNARGIAAMAISMGCFVTSDTLIKIIGREMPVGQIMFVRGLFAALLVGVLAAATGVLGSTRRAFTPAVGLRCFAEVGATLLFFSGLMRLPFGDAAAIGQFAPLAVTAGAAMFFGEPVGWRRWTATFVGLLGVLLIIRPGSSSFNPAALLIVACVLFSTVRDLVTRQMDASVPIPVLIMLSAIAIVVVGLCIKPMEDWIRPSIVTIGGLFLSAIGVSCGYYASIIAMRSGEISVVAPFRYTAMLFALVWGYVIFGEIPDRTMWAGIAIVILAGVYTFHRESVRRREAQRAAEQVS